MIPNHCIEVQTSPLDRPSVPRWFAEVAILAQHLATQGLLEAFTHQIRLVRGHFGHYEPIDFLVLLIGYAISGERTQDPSAACTEARSRATWFEKCSSLPNPWERPGHMVPHEAVCVCHSLLSGSLPLA